MMPANRSGDQPPRSKHKVTFRPSPARSRSFGSRSRIWLAREDDGCAITTSSGSPAPSVTQVSSVPGPGNFSLATCIFCTSRAPKYALVCPPVYRNPSASGAGGGVVAGDRHLQVRGLAGGGELAELAADRPDFGRPVQAQHPAERGRGDPGGALGPRLAQ